MVVKIKLVFQMYEIMKNHIKIILCTIFIFALVLTAFYAVYLCPEEQKEKMIPEKDNQTIFKEQIAKYFLNSSQDSRAVSAPNETRAIVLKDFPYRTVDRTDIIDISVGELLDALKKDILTGYYSESDFDKYGIGFEIAYEGELGKNIRSHRPNIQYQYPLHNARELGNHIAKINGYGDGFFDNIPFRMYLNTWDPTEVAWYSSTDPNEDPSYTV